MKITDATVWQVFIADEQLTDYQAAQFKRYQELLLDWNKKINLTGIETEQAIIRDHFQDSLQLRRFIDFNTIRGLIDVGTGAGFPGLPLKIMFEKLPVILIEVNQKKVRFLHTVCQELNLKEVKICNLDWRTFLRTTDYLANLVCARASLSLTELVRMFKSTCPYNNAQLVYWASKRWEIGLSELPFFKKEEWYTVGNKQRRYIFFSR